MKTLRESKPQKRVVVTGMGAITPLGLSVEETWKNALAGKSGIAPITRFAAGAFDTQFAGEIKGFQADLYIPKKEQKKMGLFTQYALACAKMALESAQFQITPDNAERGGIFIGSGMGGLPNIEEEYSKFMEKGPGRISPFFIPEVIANLAAGQVSIAFGIKGPNFSITSACATGAHSIGEAYNYIRFGLMDYMLAGGAESTVCAMGIGGFNAMRALSTRNEDPEKASRPFDKDRDGFVLAEGGGVLLLESLESAEKRGAPILCEVIGYGASSDAYHMTSPAPEGEGGARCMRMAIQDSGLQPEQIQYINAHGTSTPMGDALETKAIKNIFAAAASKVWVSSSKSMMGHALGAAGSIESILSILALRDQIVPPTINLENPSEDCDLDYIPQQARDGKIEAVLNNSFGFGGTNASLIFAKLGVG